MRLRWKKKLVDLSLFLASVYIGFSILGVGRKGSDKCQGDQRENSSERFSSFALLPDADDALMIGVMTTRKGLAKRAAAIHATWGEQGKALVVFYIGKGDNSTLHPAHHRASNRNVPAEHQNADDAFHTDEDDHDRGLDAFPGEGDDSYGDEDHRRSTEKAENFRGSRWKRGARPAGRGMAALGERRGARVRRSGAPPSGYWRSDHWEPIRRQGNGMLVVELEGISDATYPPRDKCFAMIAHMFHHFGRHFRWFARADDDVYIRVDKLTTFVTSLDGSRPWYVGQPGSGVPEERGRLGLEPRKPYCMGGPAVIFSAPALRALVPHLGACAESTVTSHEDTELGRCVLKHVKVTCTEGRQMRTLFYQDYDKRSFLDPVRPVIMSALTMHPVKDPRVLFKLHVHFLQHWLQEKLHRAKVLTSELQNTWNYRFVSGHTGEERLRNNLENSTQASKQRYDRFQTVDTFVADKLRHVLRARSNTFMGWLRSVLGLGRGVADSGHPNNASRTNPIYEEVLQNDNAAWNQVIDKGKRYVTKPSAIFHYRKEMIRDVSDEVMNFGKEAGLPLRRKHAKALYQSFSMVHGFQHMFVFSRDRGHQSVLLSRTFQHLEWREHERFSAGSDAGRPGWERKDNRSGDENTVGDSDDPKLDPRKSKGAGRDGETRVKPVDQGGGERVRGGNRWPYPPLHVLLALRGRHDTFVRFLARLNAAASLYPSAVTLHVALFADPDSQHALTREVIAGNEGKVRVTVRDLQEPFARGSALAALSEGFAAGDVLAMMDVDILLSHPFLFRVAANVRPGAAYFPIFFSRYDPGAVCYGVPQCRQDLQDYSGDAGLWRSFSYGMAALTAGDFRAAGGYDTSIVGWGKEDVDLYEKCIAQGLDIFRAPDLGAVHEFHEKVCEKTLPADQLRMCKGSQLTMIGSIRTLAQMYYDMIESLQTTS